MGVDINTMRGDEISYTHRDEVTGKYTTFAVSRIEEFINRNASKVGLYRVPVDKAFADYIQRNRGIETHRLMSLLEAEYIKPIIMLKMHDESCLIVDGNHRYAIASMLGATNLEAYVLMPEQWEQFVVTGLTDAQSERVLGIPSGLTAKGEVPEKYREDKQ